MRTVELLPHDPVWARRAREEAYAIADVLGEDLLSVHHVGSTAVPGMCAKPILDLMAVVTAVEVLHQHRAAIEALGYRWRGENGLPGRRYFTRDDSRGQRQVHLHAYAEGAADIARHLAFRDRLRADPALAAAYESEKSRCRAAHPQDPAAYNACKSGWIAAVEAGMAGSTTTPEG